MRIALNVSLAIATFILAAPALAQFSPGPNPITGTVGAQSLSSGTGTIDSGGRISITTNGVALTMTGTSALLNNGTIQTTGTGRAIDSNSGSANLTVTNNGLIRSNVTDAFRVNTNSAVALINSGIIEVLDGGQAIDWAAITSKSNTLTNLAGGVIRAVAEDAVRPGTNGVIVNAGTIAATPTNVASPSGSDGIDVRTFTGIQVTNSGTITGRHGIATDGGNSGPSTITVTNNTGGVIAALNGSGLNIDGVAANVTANVVNQFGAVFRGGVLSAATDADGDGIDVDGVLTLANAGDILGLGAKGNNNAEGIAAGGGTIVNYASGRIVGSSLAADAPLGDSARAGNGILIDNSNGGSAVAATTIVNSGLIEGKTGFAIRIVGTHADSITNEAGGIFRGAVGGAAIQTGGGADTVINRGAIVGSSGSAIDLQDGDDHLKIEGAAASVSGDISGGAGANTLTVEAGAGNSFAYAGAIANFDTVEVRSGEVTLSGASSYTGTTVLTGGTLKLDGVNRLAADSALQLNGGTLQLANAGGANGQTFASLALSADSTVILGASSLTFDGLGAIAADASLTLLDWMAATSPDYAFRLLGDVSSDAAFLSLLGRTTINGLAAAFHFDGTYTTVAPVPLPAAFWMLLSGVGLLAGAVRRKQ